MSRRHTNWNEIYAWADAIPGRTAEDVVDRWFNDEPDRPRALARVRQRMSRRRRAAGARERDEEPLDGSNRDESTGEGPPRPAPDFETARLDRVPFYELQLAEALADLAWVRASGLVGRISQLAALVANLRQELDQAKAERGAVVQLERSPAAVTAEVARRDRAIRILAAANEAAAPRGRNL